MSLREVLLLAGGGVAGFLLGFFLFSRHFRRVVGRLFGVPEEGDLTTGLRVLAERRREEKKEWLREVLGVLDSLSVGGASFLPGEEWILLNETFAKSVGLKERGVQEVQAFEIPVLGEAILRASSSREALRIPGSGFLLRPFALGGTPLVLLEDERAKLRRLRSLRYFLTALWHEIQTPLAVLSGYVGTLEEGTPLEGEVLSRMMRQIRRLEGIVREMQRLSLLLEGKKGPITCETFLSILRRAVAEREGERGDLMVTVDIAGVCDGRSLPLSEGEAFVLLANLVANAFAFSTPQGEVRVSVSGDSSGLFLVLENTASLADAEFLSWFFDPTDTSPRGGSGKGVGLYLVREVVEENGGEVRLRVQGNRVALEVFLPWEESQRDGSSQ